MDAPKAMILGVITLVAHHAYIHPELEGVERYYQVDDTFKVDSHEFWEVVLLVGAIYLSIKGNGKTFYV